MTQAIDCYLATQNNLTEHGLSPTEWMVLQDLKVILEVSVDIIETPMMCVNLYQAPHACQQSMSSESTPMLSGAVSALECLMERWEGIARIATHCAPIINVGLAWADKYGHKMSKTNAYAIAMCEFGLGMGRSISHNFYSH